MVDKSDSGGILALIGAILLIHAGSLAFIRTQDLGWEHLIQNPTLLATSFMVTIVWGIIGLAGAIITIKKNVTGGIICIIIGLIAIVGQFIPLEPIRIPLLSTVRLNGSLIFIDPILMLVGGILSLKLRD